MNTLQKEGNYRLITAMLKQKYPQLTDEDLKLVEGKEEEMLERVRERLGKGEEELRREIEEF